MRKILAAGAIVSIAVLALAQLASDVLGKFASAENAAKTLTAVCTVQHVNPSAPSVPATTFTVSLAKPNRARIDMPEELVVADGASITTYDKDSKTFMKKPQTEADFKALFACDELVLFGAFYDAGFFDKVRGGKVSKRNRRGTAYDVVETTLELDGTQSAALYIDPADKMLKMGEFTAEDAKETVAVTAKEFTLDGAQGADIYAFKAPDGSHEITLADLRRASTFEAPPTYFEKALETWHMWQVDERGNLPNGGHDYCGPTATTNALVYLGLHGYPNLFQGDDMAALGLMGTLGSAEYMGTDPLEGTTPPKVMRGLVKYIGAKGYGIKSAELEGWRSMDRTTRGYKISDTIDFDWVRRGIATPNSLVLFNIGWCKDNGNGNIYRVTGHWLTAVGYGSTGGDSADPNLYIIHDPAKHLRNPPSDPKTWLALDSVKLTPITKGTLSSAQSGGGLPRSAVGLYTIAGPGIGGYSKADFAVLDSVIVIVLKPAK